jgi:biotin transporter BioY
MLASVRFLWNFLRSVVGTVVGFVFGFVVGSIVVGCFVGRCPDRVIVDDTVNNKHQQLQ